MSHGQSAPGCTCAQGAACVSSSLLHPPSYSVADAWERTPGESCRPCVCRLVSAGSRNSFITPSVVSGPADLRTWAASGRGSTLGVGAGGACACQRSAAPPPCDVRSTTQHTQASCVSNPTSATAIMCRLDWLPTNCQALQCNKGERKAAAPHMLFARRTTYESPARMRSVGPNRCTSPLSPSLHEQWQRREACRREGSPRLAQACNAARPSEYAA